MSYSQWVLKMFLICELLSITTRLAAPIFGRCSSFQCFSRMWSMSLISCRGPASHKLHGHCPSPLLTQCSAEHLQTRHSLQNQLRCQIPQPGPTNILFNIHYEVDLLTTLDQTLLLVYLYNSCLELPHIRTAFTQDLSREDGPRPRALHALFLLRFARFAKYSDQSSAHWNLLFKILDTPLDRDFTQIQVVSARYFH